MELSKRTSLSKEIFDNPAYRYCEIYKIINIKNGKIYVGQTVSHILNHKRYRQYRHEGRFWWTPYSIRRKQKKRNRICRKIKRDN